MKILVLSDSHGDLSNMERAVEQSAPRMIVHLGDLWRDGERLHSRFPDIPFHQVPGNCDLRPEAPAEKLLCVEDMRLSSATVTPTASSSPFSPQAMLPKRRPWTFSSSATPTGPSSTGAAGPYSSTPAASAAAAPAMPSSPSSRVVPTGGSSFCPERTCQTRKKRVYWSPCYRKDRCFHLIGGFL